jgi:hypothetical protein
MALRIKIVRPDLAEIKLSGAELAGSKADREIGVLKAGEMKEVRWKVKITDPSKFEAEVSIKSTRGGIDMKKVGKAPAQLPSSVRIPRKNIMEGVRSERPD